MLLEPTPLGLIFDWEAIQEILRSIAHDGLPDDPTDPRCVFEAAVKNAKNLRILFGGQWDKAAMDEVQRLAREIVTMRQWQSRTTHHVSRSIQ